jgi:hypothetical protein
MQTLMFEMLFLTLFNRSCMEAVVCGVIIPLGRWKFFMLSVTTLPLTLILYLWDVLVWKWQSRLCLNETCLKWQRQSKVPPNARCILSYSFSTQKVNVQRKFTDKLLLFMVTLWISKVWRGGAMNSPKGGLMFTTNKGVVSHLWTLTIFFRKLKGSSCKLAWDDKRVASHNSRSV